MTKTDTNAAKNILENSKSRLKVYLVELLKSKTFSYETFGKEIEPFVTAELIKIFSEEGFIKKESDYHLASNKNEFPDFTLFTKPPFVIDYKSGNHSKKSAGVWTKTKNSNNDLGTLNKWPKNIKKFGGENIYF